MVAIVFSHTKKKRVCINTHSIIPLAENTTRRSQPIFLTEQTRPLSKEQRRGAQLGENVLKSNLAIATEENPVFTPRQ